MFIQVTLADVRVYRETRSCFDRPEGDDSRGLLADSSKIHSE